MNQEALTFRGLFERELPYVYNTLRRLGIREADLKDVSQEVFLTVHGLLPDYDSSRPLRPWLMGIAYRITLRYRDRFRRSREVLGTPDEPVDTTPLADERISTQQKMDLALRAIDAIDVHRRVVFVMSEIDGVPMSDIAEALGLPVNTAYSRLRLARREFAEAVRRARLREESAHGRS